MKYRGRDPTPAATLTYSIGAGVRPVALQLILAKGFVLHILHISDYRASLGGPTLVLPYSPLSIILILSYIPAHHTTHLILSPRQKFSMLQSTSPILPIKPVRRYFFLSGNLQFSYSTLTAHNQAEKYTCKQPGLFLNHVYRFNRLKCKQSHCYPTLRCTSYKKQRNHFRYIFYEVTIVIEMYSWSKYVLDILVHLVS